MRRLVWFALGAGAGILGYRAAMRLRDQAQEQGVVLTAADTVRSARGTVQAAGRGLSGIQGSIRQLRGAEDQ